MSEGLLREQGVIKKSIDEQKGEIVIYRTEDGRTTLDVTLEEQTVWLSLNQMARLFQRDKSVISRHLGNIFKTRELLRDSVVAFFATGKRLDCFQIIEL